MVAGILFATSVALQLAAAGPVVVDVQVRSFGLEPRAQTELASHLEDELALIGVRSATRSESPQASLVVRATRVGPLLRADLLLIEADGTRTQETRNARVDQAITSTLLGPDIAARLRTLRVEEAPVHDTVVEEDVTADPLPVSAVEPAAFTRAQIDAESESEAMPFALTWGGAGVATFGALALAVGGGAVAHEVGTLGDATAQRADKDRALQLAPVAFGVAAVGGALLLSGGAAAGVGALGL